MKNYQQLLNNISGQLLGISKMINENKDCFKILVQFRAVDAALNAVTIKYLKENFIKCMDNTNSKNKGYLCEKFLREIMK